VPGWRGGGRAGVEATRRSGQSAGVGAPASGQAVDEAPEAVDRTLKRGRELKRAFERRQDRDEFGRGLDHRACLTRDLGSARVDAVAELMHPDTEVDQLAGAAVEPRPELEDGLGARVEPCPEYENRGGAFVEPFAEHENLCGPLIEPYGDLEHGAADIGDLLAEFEHPVELGGGGPRGASDRRQVREHSVDDRLGRVERDAENAQHRHSSSD